MDDYIMHINR